MNNVKGHVYHQTLSRYNIRRFDQVDSWVHRQIWEEIYVLLRDQVDNELQHKIFNKIKL